MATPASPNSISLNNVNTELGLSATASITMNDTAVRSLAGKPTNTSEISMNDLRGKSAVFATTISTSQQQLNLRTYLIDQGWNQSAGVRVTIGAGVYIWSDSTSVAGLTTGGPYPNGLTIVNNGYIMGKGGTGAAVVRGSAPAGGPAISLGVNVTIDNTNASAYIGGGGGGGSGIGGGGAGGGVGSPAGDDPVASGGAGGAIGQLGSNGVQRGDNTAYWYSGGGGGRIFPGTGGSGGVGGGGGGGAGGGGGGFNGGPGAAGGGANNPGGTGDIGTAGGGGGGGGWGASGGGNPAINGTGGAGGRAVQINGFTATFVNGNTTRVWGAVS